MMKLNDLKNLALENLPRSVIITDNQGEIIYVNQRSNRVLGLTSRECLGKNFHQLLHREQKIDGHPSPDCKILKAIENQQKIVNVSDFFLVKGERIPVEYSLYPLKDRGKLKGFLLRFRKESLSTRDENQFLAALSHELKTPLSIIKSYNHLLKTKLEDDFLQENENYLAVIDDKVDVLSELIERMLETIKLGKGKLKFHDQRIDVKQELEKVVEQMQRATETHQLKLSGNVSGKVLIDPQRLFQVMSNLISNAVKYSPQADEVDVRLSETNRSIQIEVQDYGTGIKQEDASQIFKPFFRTDRAQEQQGLGMGLFFAKQIINHYAGDIWFVTSPGQGSKFYIQLPKLKVSLN